MPTVLNVQVNFLDAIAHVLVCTSSSGLLMVNALFKLINMYITLTFVFNILC